MCWTMEYKAVALLLCRAPQFVEPRLPLANLTLTNKLGKYVQARNVEMQILYRDYYVIFSWYVHLYTAHTDIDT